MLLNSGKDTNTIFIASSICFLALPRCKKYKLDCSPEPQSLRTISLSLTKKTNKENTD
nr:MAG TPA: hypothetical protein [Bacteriophage sp.]